MIADSLFNVFLYFRLGNSTKEKDMILHYDLHATREFLTSTTTGAAGGGEGERKGGEGEGEEAEVLEKDIEIFTTIQHNHKFKSGRRNQQLMVTPKSFNDLLPLSQGDVHINSNSNESPHERKFRIIVISDTHERHYTLGTLPACDILIHAGDLLMTSRKVSESSAIYKLKQFNDWMKDQPATFKIVIGGNHDKVLEELSTEELQDVFRDCTYLCNNGIEVMGLKIWASPASQGASGNRAFQSPEFLNAAEIAARAAGPVDILVTHGTAHKLQSIIHPRLMHVSGHYHCHHGLNIYETEYKNLLTVAAPIMDHNYNPHNLPIILDIQVSDVKL